MPETGPIQLLRFSTTEYQRKTGGGGDQPPFVPVDAELRRILATEVAIVSSYAEAARQRNDLPTPVVAKLRPKALAKSNRPYGLLAELALPVEAALGSGELVIRGTVETLAGLRTAVLQGHRKSDIRDISSFESFEVWAPNDITSAPSWASTATVKMITVTLFPWLTLESAYSGRQDIGTFFLSLGLEIQHRWFDGSQETVYLSVPPGSTPERLIEVQGIREVRVTPDYGSPGTIAPQSFDLLGTTTSDLAVSPSEGQVTVGVFDSGVESTVLQPWISGRETYDTGADRNPDHGTFVAGLIVAAREFNSGDTRFPADQAKIFDAQVLPADPLSEGLLLTRIEEVLATHGGPSGPKVWNCSFNQNYELSPVAYSDFAQQLDRLSRAHGVLFVQASGNYEAAPYRTWPTLPGMPYSDRLASPAEAVRSLTVGAIAHKGGYVPIDSPASYSRRGPGFAYVAKPDVSHYAGDVSSSRRLTRFGIESIIANDRDAESVGTSFAAPLISAIAANTWEQVERSAAVTQVKPELVKGLLAHSAALRSQTQDAEERNYRGWGVPESSADILKNRANEFTTVHEVVLTPGNDWLKTPFPMPACLLADGKFKGEIVLTISYDPPIDAAFGVEAVRYDVESSFGRVSTGATGHINLDSIVPHDKAQSSHAWESQRVEGGKWTPLKTYRKRYPVGTVAGDWGLRMSLTERVSGEQRTAQSVYAFLTFRSQDPDLPVYNDGMVALNASQYESKSMVTTGRLRVGN